jgi:hypothetical protein
MSFGDQAGKVYIEWVCAERNQAIGFHQLYYVAPVSAVVGQKSFPQQAVGLEPANFCRSGRDGRSLVHYIPCASAGRENVGAKQGPQQD